MPRILDEPIGTFREDLTAFLRRRALEAWGLAALLFAAFLACALVSHNPLDPSFNTASHAEPTNWMGYAGAYASDLLIQMSGLTGLFVTAAFGTWGILALSRRRFRFFWLRLTGLILSIPLLAGALALLPPTLSLGTAAPGGVLGAFLHRAFGPALGQVGYGLTFGGLAFIIYLYAFALTLRQWRKLLGRVGGAIGRAARRVWHFLALLMARNPQDLSWQKPTPRARPAGRKPAARSRRKAAAADDDDDDDLPAQPPPVKRQAPSITSKAPRQGVQASFKLGQETGGFALPSLSLLASVPARKKATLSESALSQNAKMLESVLDDFGINGVITKIRPGPVVTLYELEPSPGTKSSRVIGLADDIARSMSAVSARISVIPGKNAIGIELPNAHRETVYLKEILESAEYNNAESKLPIALGKDIGGDIMITDLSKMPHLLVAGTTGSGKSVAINTMILSLLYRLTPEQCRFIMIDPKMLELSIYDGIPHLLSPVVTEPGKAVVALKWTVKEMENRYRLMSTLGVRNVGGYNQRIQEAIAKNERLTRQVQTGYDPDTGKPIVEEIPLDMAPLPYIVVVVDEMADLMLVAGKDIEGSIQRLAQMARAAGIHLIMATQRPSVDVITGVIKANFPTRISFQVTSKIDSRTILGEQGAEQLLGQGDMLYMAGGGRITRVHGPFVGDNEVDAIVRHLKEQGEPQYVEDVTTAEEEGNLPLGGEEGDEGDLYRQATEIVINERKASTSYIQRRLKIGYNRAANLIEQMEREGIVGPANHVGKREVLVKG